MKSEQEHQEIVHITYKLTGEQARIFATVKKSKFLENNTELARSLMLERLYVIANELVRQGDAVRTEDAAA